MKLSDFDFRIWSERQNAFINNIAIQSKFFKNDSCLLIDFPYCSDFTDTYLLELELYTGFTDRSWNKIYEGDICRYINDDTGFTEIKRVVFEDGCFLLKSFDNNSIAYFYQTSYIEVLGNIHENEELLKNIDT